MTNLKSILLGTGAAIVAASAAQAADLPVVEPVDYVQICDLYGDGYFYIPGTSTCIQLGGYVRFQAVVGEDVVGPGGGGLLTSSPFAVRSTDRVLAGGGATFTVDDDDSTFAFGAAARFTVDTRTETEFGTLRGYIQMEGGTDYGGFQTSGRDNDNSILADIASGGDDIAFEIDEAYIQFDIGPGFVTAGLAPSFAGVAGPSSLVDTPFTSGGGDNFLIGYTLDIGPAQVGIALEDTFDRTQGFGVTAGSFATVAGLVPFTAPTAGTLVDVSGQDGDGQDLPILSGFARFSLADIVDLRVAGAISNTNEVTVRVIDGTGAAPVLLERELEDDLAFAIAASAGTEFAFLNLGIGGTYTEGLVEYAIDAGAFETDFFLTGAIPVGATPAVALASLDVEQVEAYAVYANIGFDIASYGVNLIGAYGEIEYPTAVAGGAGGDSAEAFTLAANVNVSPVEQLDLIAEIFYQDIDVDANLTAGTTGSNAVDGSFDEDAIGAVFRMQRNF